MPLSISRFSSRRLAILAGGALAVLGAVVAILVWGSGPWRSAPSRQAPVNLVLVTIDTLRADRVNAALTPNIEALSARGVSFTHARTVAPLTLPAHVSLMTGLLPPRHGVRLNGVHRLPAGVPTMAQLLSKSGYRTGAFVGAYVLDRRFGLAPGFDTYDDEIARDDASAGLLEAERRGGVVAERAIGWLASLRDDGQPFMMWVHLYDPHAPYEPPPDMLARAMGQPYDGEVAYADAQVGRIIDALRARGVLDRTVIVVAGDHGESLGEHGESTHGLLLYEGALRIPVVMAGPGVKPSRRHDPISLIDILPTVLGLLGLQPPEGSDGRDVLGVAGVRPDAETYSETQYPEVAGCSPLRALLDERWKFIGGPPEPEVYDLNVDPGEQQNVAAARQSIAVAMGSRVADIVTRGVPSVSVAPSREVVERLGALGYVARGQASATTGPGAPSPTTIVREWARFELAMADLAAGRTASGIDALAVLVRERPEAPAFQTSYARALAESGRTKAAIDVYRRALSQWPQDTVLLHGYAGALRDADQPAEAMKAEEAVLAIDPTDAAAQNGIGLLQADAGRAAEARQAFARAVVLDPYAISYRVNLGNAARAAGDVAAAEAAYREALRLDPRSADGANGLGVLLVQSGRPRDAVATFKRVLIGSPAFYDVWLNLGIAYQELGDVERAALSYRRVLAAPAGAAAPREAARQLLASLPH